VFSSQRQRQQRVKDFAYHGEFVGRAVAWMAGLFPPYQAPKNFPEKRFPPPGRHGFGDPHQTSKKARAVRAIMESNPSSKTDNWETGRKLK